MLGCSSITVVARCVKGGETLKGEGKEHETDISCTTIGLKTFNFELTTLSHSTYYNRQNTKKGEEPANGVCPPQHGVMLVVNCNPGLCCEALYGKFRDGGHPLCYICMQTFIDIRSPIVLRCCTQF